MKVIYIQFKDGTKTIIPYMVQSSIDSFLSFYYPGRILDFAEVANIPDRP